MLTAYELTQISNRLVVPMERRQLLTLRRKIKVNKEYSTFARYIGWKSIEDLGTARERRAGSSSSDKTFVGEKVTPVTQPAYILDTHIRYDEDEVNESREATMLGHGPSVPIDQIRILNARRIISEDENRFGFNGSRDGAVKGLRNAAGIQMIDAAETGTGSGAAKKIWPNKTPAQILVDMLALLNKSRYGAVYQPDTIYLSPDYDNLLDVPYSTASTDTVRSWLMTKLGRSVEIVAANEMSKAVTGLEYDIAIALDTRPEIVELAILEDQVLSAPRQVDTREWEMQLRTKTGGVMIYEKKAVAVMNF